MFSFREPTINLPDLVVLLRNLQESFQLSWNPDSLACREKEKEEVFKFWTNCIKNHTSEGMYISGDHLVKTFLFTDDFIGSPGTGKSASIKEVMDQVVQFDKKNSAKYGPTKIIYLNCMDIGNPRKIYQTLVKELSIRSSEMVEGDNGDDLPASIANHLTSKRKFMT